MMVVFVSQCEKKALNKTRRVLDAFANRIGDNTWQTVITNEGLTAVKKLLRKSASKNTAVSCHWLRSRSRSELVWIIGNRNKFNAQGVVPVNVTQKDIINTQWENDWRYLPLIKSLTALAALFHDFGKASLCFQEKLQPKSHNKFSGDPLRHEWVSTLLFNSFVNGDDHDEKWLERLANGELDKFLPIKNTQKPLANLPPAASLLAWLVVSHHKLPINYDDTSKGWRGYKYEPAETISKLLGYISQEWGYENKKDASSYQKRLQQCLDFPHGLPSQSKPWLEQIMKWAGKLQACMPLLNQAMEDGSWRLVLHHSRLSLMLGDHHYSSKDADKNWYSDLDLIANTHRQDHDGFKKGAAKQKLDEHLVGVAKAARKIVRLLPAFESEPPHAYDIKSLKKKSPVGFIWQDKAVDKITEWKQKLPVAQKDKLHGFFAVNMASTGCGKTYANAKVMRALSNSGESLRFILALGLRSLTLQTGDEYRDRIGLDNSELAVLIGSRAVMELHKLEQGQQDKDPASIEASGSESLETLLDDEVVDYGCVIPEDGLNTILKEQRDRQFLYAPVLVCTIDHMMSATECKRGGRYILPSLRLMSSDLVIDEIDDFDGKDLIAIGRLIHMAGMLGRKVMISSATIPPDLAQGYLNVYREGWQLFAKTRDVSMNIGCAWIDEFSTQIESLSDLDTKEAINRYQTYHETFIHKRVKKLKDAPVKRMANITHCGHIKGSRTECNNSDKKLTIESAYFNIIQQAIIQKHQEHGSADPTTAKTVSFGVVRMANIDPCVALTEYLAVTTWPQDVDIRVMAYHSQQVLLLRSEQEKHLDAVLKRNEKKDEISAAFKNTVIRQHLDNSQSKHLIFILVATPVEEVGRDHDFDWAVVEPSSFRSIIQLAGRVLRHRDKTPKTPNIALMQYNLRALKSPDDKPAYCKPGYETDSSCILMTHDIAQLIDSKLIANGINAIPRIQRNKDLKPKENFADLEHYAISKLLTAYKTTKMEDLIGPETMQGWLTQCWWLTALPQKFNQFRESTAQIKLFLVPGDDVPVFMQKDENGCPHNREGRYGIEKKDMLDEHESVNKWWLSRDYQQLIKECAEKHGITEQKAALMYGELSFPMYGDGIPKYQYAPQLGLSKLT